MTAQDAFARLKGWWAEARVNKLFWRGLALAALVVAIDQASKMWIVHGLDLPRLGKIEVSGIFDLSYVENRGASFGMLHGMRWPLALISIGVVLGLGWWLGRLKRIPAVLGVGFIIGGALGNQIGGGTGKKVATVAGAAAGGYAGNKTQERIQANSTYQATETRCQTVTDTQEVTRGYDVVYRIGDEEGTVFMDHDPGDRIPLSNGELVVGDRR